jgi:hypothetical protein
MVTSQIQCNDVHLLVQYVSNTQNVIDILQFNFILHLFLIALEKVKR